MALVVITGGVRSGKSRAAQELAESRARAGQAVMVAVFASESDVEMVQRIEAHRASRPEGFEVIEVTGSADWLGSVPGPTLLVVDCLGTCLGRAMLETWDETAQVGADMGCADELPAGFESAFVSRVGGLVDALASRDGDTLVVTNEVGQGVVPTHATGRIFRDELGRANRLLVDVADAAYVAIAGRLLDLASLPRDIHWPED